MLFREWLLDWEGPTKCFNERKRLMYITLSNKTGS